MTEFTLSERFAKRILDGTALPYLKRNKKTPGSATLKGTALQIRMSGKQVVVDVVIQDKHGNWEVAATLASGLMRPLQDGDTITISNLDFRVSFKLSV